MSSRLLELMSGAFPWTAEALDQASGPDRSAPASSPGIPQVFQALRSDEDIAEDLRKGNADALTLLFKRHHLLVFRIARRILRIDAEAEDTVQQIFLDVFRSIEQFDRSKASFKTWLLMFAYQRTLNRRRSMLSSRFFDSVPLEDFLPELLECSQKIGEGMQNRILLRQALGSLQPRQRRTIELTYYEGLTAEEVSQRTGETVRVVRHNLYRGLERLRKYLGQEVSQRGKEKGGRP